MKRLANAAYGMSMACALGTNVVASMGHPLMALMLFIVGTGALYISKDLESKVESRAATISERVDAERAIYLPAALREVDALLPWTEPVAPASLATANLEGVVRGLAAAPPRMKLRDFIEEKPVSFCPYGRDHCGAMVNRMNGGTRLWFCSSACRDTKVVT